MNTSTSLDVMVKLGVFEKMPKQGSISAKELGVLVNLEPNVIGSSTASHTGECRADGCISTSHEDVDRYWNCCRDGRGYLCAYTEINGLFRGRSCGLLQSLVSFEGDVSVTC